MIKVVIIDDHPIVLEGLKNLLSSQDDITVTGYFDTGMAALAALDKAMPDLLLLDINLPDISGLDLCKQIRRKNKDLKIIALSVHNERPVIKSMLQQGVNGYVLKNSVGEEIIHAIHETMDGHTYLCPKTQEVLKNNTEGGLVEIPRITRREKEILELIGQGCTTAQIAAQLFISIHTVESHRKNLMGKFEVSNMTSVIRLATEYNLL
ncbi:response regulator [Chitinophaga nivalis]|uniref:Response regulator transcription factor n=1 Tax=Chitinophaga nivalis TaxID=2991709 RepID=A0ABT3IIL7_9BACT|nr:response regulator transcription factor [Chitinophaga nivalis]MCW3466715.1 response regulator transcription factor [Chitinophaga nivalis]MCW3483594.1 response regulator transcription factor [Chitinophaga nivalis]